MKISVNSFVLFIVLCIIFDTVIAIKKKCLCQEHHLPVCGQDDITYANPCLLRCAGTKQIYSYATTNNIPNKKQNPKIKCFYSRKVYKW